MLKTRIFISILIVNLFTISLYAQSVESISTSTTSSYSYYGIGESLYNGVAENMGKAGLATAVVSDFSPSFVNAATFYHNKLSTFQVGVKLSEKQQVSDSKKNWSNNGALNYVQLAFPITKWWGSGIGMIPAYGQGYQLKNDSVKTPFGYAKNSFNGKGNCNTVSWSNGINPFKWFSDSLAEDFSIGIGASYLFGNSYNYDSVIYHDYSKKGYYNYININSNSYNGMQLNFGLIHKFKIHKNVKMIVGGSYIRKAAMISDNVNELRYFQSPTSVTEVFYYNETTKKITLPSKYSVGVNFILKNNLQIGVEYKKALWSGYKNELKKSKLNDATTYILGVEYNPQIANGGFFKNVNYRIGCRYTQNPYMIGNNTINEKALTFGFGLPIKRSFSTVNIGLEAMQRGVKKDGLVLENYFSAYVGLTINDRWFIKQKYD